MATDVLATKGARASLAMVCIDLVIPYIPAAAPELLKGEEVVDRSVKIICFTCTN